MLLYKKPRSFYHIISVRKDHEIELCSRRELLDRLPLQPYRVYNKVILQ